MSSTLFSEFLLNLPLYEWSDLTDELFEEVFAMTNSTNVYTFDAYCPLCKKERTFQFGNIPEQYKNQAGGFVPQSSIISFEEKPFQITFIYFCSKDYSHSFRMNTLIKGAFVAKQPVVGYIQGSKPIENPFSFESQKKQIIKIGQYPARADIEVIGNPKFAKILKEDFSNFKKAIGLFSHGVGAGSFVYLRRILENLVFNTFQQNIESIGISRDEFKIKRFDEKIEALRDYLPSMVIKTKSALYGVLSKGVHELSEEQCLKHFELVKAVISAIVNEKIEILEKKEHEKKIEEELKKVGETLKNKGQ